MAEPTVFEPVRAGVQTATISPAARVCRLAECLRCMLTDSSGCFNAPGNLLQNEIDENMIDAARLAEERGMATSAILRPRPVGSLFLPRPAVQVRVFDDDEVSYSLLPESEPDALQVLPTWQRRGSTESLRTIRGLRIQRRNCVVETVLMLVVAIDR